MKLKKFICFIVGLVLFSTISMNPYASEQVDLKDLPETAYPQWLATVTLLLF